MDRSLAVQLTTRCNLACAHCFVEKRETDLSLELLRRVADYAHAEGYRRLDFTGGEPTLHPELPAILELLEDRGLGYTLVSNGWNLGRLIALVAEGRRPPSRMSLSLDGGDADAHDLNRRPGSFSRVLAASETCRRERIPFGYRTTLLNRNVEHLPELVTLATEQGAEELALMPLIPTPASVREDQLPPPGRLLRIPAEVARLQRGTPVRLVLTAGHFSWELLEPCPALAERALFLTSRGELSLCCHLAGHEADGTDADLVVRLEETSLREGAAALRARAAELRDLKLLRRDEGELGLLDYFPCWFCLKHFGKVEWLRGDPGHPWLGDPSGIAIS
jgi:MoaA/NifB/PqqE/SkfB family radical SAM enzyme